MKNTKGFTLIELLSVIALIALISLLIVPSIMNSATSNKDELSNTTKELIYSAAGNYLEFNQTDYVKQEGITYCPTIGNLIDKGFLEPNLEDVETGEKIAEKRDLYVISSYNGYKYEYNLSDSTSEITCTPPGNFVVTNKGSIQITNLVSYSNEDCSIHIDKIYVNKITYVKVYVSTVKIEDGSILSLKVRRGTVADAEGFTSTGGTVIDNKSEFILKVPSTAEAGDYVVEVTGDNALKGTANFRISLKEEELMPDMLAGLYAIKYDETVKKWQIVNPYTTQWYDYENQMWANAVILKDGVSKSVGDYIKLPGEDDSSSTDVIAMYVWIPRYSYTIGNTYGVQLEGGYTPSKSDPGAIDIKFVNKSVNETGTASYTGDTATNWRTHPAFNWDTNSNGSISSSEQLSGIWVGKFETSGGLSGIAILPNYTSSYDLSLSEQFTAAQLFGTYLEDNSNVDAHMMKNSEWGAIAYLSQSKYGKYGNSAYTGAFKEVYKNDSSYSYGSYTGRSSGKPSTDDYSVQGTCKYDDIEDRGDGTGACGTGASTTGNIYGVYDMSGGNDEYVMGYLTIANKNYKNGNYSYFGWTIYNNDAGFTSKIADKYFDNYTSMTRTKACDGGICYGHALSETVGWEGNGDGFLDYEWCWVTRGGNHSTSGAGIFNFGSYTGEGGYGTSYRSVLLATR